MSQEIEFKLLLPAEWQSSVAHLELLRGQTPRQQRLLTRYFDTPEQLLASQRRTLRLRQIDDHYWQTLKSAGNTQSGLSERQELELPVAGAELDLDAFPDPDFQRWQRAEHLSTRLQAQFETRFDRLSWQLDYGTSQIELALDQGQILCGHQHEALSELELELKAGDVQDLRRLARQLSRELPICPGNQSKAARGYRLLRHEPDLLPSPALDNKTQLINALLSGLSPWFADRWLDSDPDLLVQWLRALGQLVAQPEQHELSQLADELASTSAEAEWRRWRNNPALGQHLLQLL